MKVGDLVTLSSRGWKLQASQGWLRRVSVRNLDVSAAMYKNQKELLGMIMGEAPGYGEGFIVRWVKDGPRGPYDYSNFYSKNEGPTTTRFERGHLKYVSKCK
tara:strand:- start:786 stop:1091 length:306 start_codon:yes stop_codon:yes gene_type:complete